MGCIPQLGVDLMQRQLAYEFVITIHSYLRWGLLAAGLLSGAASLHGWRAGRRWSFLDERLAVTLVLCVDLQLVVGLLLYLVLSPFGEAVFAGGLRAAGATPTVLFFGLLHPCLMILSFLVAHAARGRSKKASSDEARFRIMSRGVLLWLLLVALAIPWPWMPYGRAFFRGI
jgi:hypothetical protein